MPAMVARQLTLNSPVLAWALLIIGLLATASAWHDRHPDTSADFTILYLSAQQPPEKMFGHQPRGNMNPPVFQLLMRPLTSFPLRIAGAIFRVVSFAALGGCVWWLARTSTEPWTLADYGALLAWAPMASVIYLNQVTWLLWPLLLWAWWCWRRDRWSAGAVGYGVALGLKPFLGVFLLWLLITRRWRAAIVSFAVAALTFAVGIAAYGVDVSLAWIRALADVTWTFAVMNASLQGILARTAVPHSLALAGSALVVIITLVRTRRQQIDESWLPLMVSALLASPLGWLYYIWWILPGVKPSRLLLETPLLWVPMAITIAGEPSTWRTLTLGSIYFWGLLMLWVARTVTAERSVALRTLVPSIS